MLSGQQDPKSPYPEDLPRWLELDYHRRVRPLRRKRKWVTLGAVAVTVAIVIWTVLPGKHAAHQAGPVATAHAMFNNDCARCHVEAWQPVQRIALGDGVRSVPDTACKECHDGAPHFDVTHGGAAAHHAPQALASGCAGCHREHRGKTTLARVADGYCTACHADLPPGSKRENVASFAVNHPPFHWREGDKAQRHRLGFSHASHLKLDLNALRQTPTAEGLASLEGLGARLECTACHQPDSERRYMRPISYQQHCARCHPLLVSVAGEFEDPQAQAAAEKFRKIRAPHDTPEKVRAVLRERFLDFVKENPVVLSSTPAAAPKRPFPGKDPAAVTEEQWLWVKSKVQDAEQRLFTQSQLQRAERQVFGNAVCSQCHKGDKDSARQPGELPVYEKPNIPARWSTQSVFSHDSHQMLECVACHENPDRQAPAALLLPSIQSCKVCHTPAAGARSDCAECHLFHDRNKEQAPTIRLKIDNGVLKNH